MIDNIDLAWEEAFRFRPGQIVELKSQPGTFDIVATYEAMMVPPIWLVNDPKPRYAHALAVISHPVREIAYVVTTLCSQPAEVLEPRSDDFDDLQK